MATVAHPITSLPRSSAQRLLLHEVPWKTYERLLDDYAGRQAPRFAFDRGTLEIVMTLSSDHEKIKRALELLIDLITGELEIDAESVGGMTFRRAAVQRGFEPDSSYYIQTASAVAGRRIDPEVDPPPDLIIEIDLTTDSQIKDPLYAGLEIPEVWRFDGERVSIRLLRDGAYDEAPASLALPLLTGDVLNGFLAEFQALPRHRWQRSVQEWVRRQAAPARQLSSP
jgi:Uma2 family endonuclease